MLQNVLLENPVTQSTEAVVELLKYLGKPIYPLPEAIKLAKGLQLTKSARGDVFYCTSQKYCTCPGFYYRRTCKHIKDLESIKAHSCGIGTKASDSAEVGAHDKGKSINDAKLVCEKSRQQAREYQARQRALRQKAKKDCSEPIDDIGGTYGKWSGGYNGPVEPEEVQ